MAEQIKTVTATINGQSYTLKYNATSGLYEGTITAPNKSSYSKTNHVYDVNVTAVDMAGNSASESSTLRVKETVKPTISIKSPTSGQYLSQADVSSSFTITDNDSGVDMSTLVVKVDGVAISSSDLTTSPSGETTTVSFTSNVKDGSHTINISVSDHDGNNATATSTFNTVTTVPTLSVSSPTDNSWSKAAGITVNGTTDSTAKVVIKLDDAQVATPTVGSDGKFVADIDSVTEGDHTITVTSTGLSGLDSTLTRTVHVDRTAPKISNIKLTPSPSTTSASVKITVTITD